MRYVIGLSLVALVIWTLQVTGILMAAAIFLMVGTVPGTHIVVPPMYMLGLLGFAALVLAYWLFRQRAATKHPTEPVLRDESKTVPQLHTKPKKPLHPTFPAQHLGSVLAALVRHWHQLRLSVRHLGRQFAAALHKIVHPAQLFITALIIVSIIAAREIAFWARPHLQRLLAWLRLQASYSLKGTMLSAHRWSSLSRKLLSSLTSLLRRCSSALKRGKSFLIRSAR